MYSVSAKYGHSWSPDKVGTILPLWLPDRLDSEMASKLTDSEEIDDSADDTAKSDRRRH